MSIQVAVIGLGVFGNAVARSLAKKGAEVIAIDTSREVVQKISDAVSIAVALNATDAEALVEAGVKDVDVAVVAVGHDIESSILTTAIVKNLGVDRIVARAVNHLHAQILREVGATDVVFPEQDIGVRVAQTIISPNLLDYVSLSKDYVIAEVTASESWVGRALNEIRFRNTLGVTVVAMRRASEGEGKSKSKLFIPEPEVVVELGDVLVLAGRKNAVEKLIEA